MLLSKVIDRFAEESANEIAMIVADYKISWGILDSKLESIKNELKDINGTRLLLYLDHTIDSLILLLAGLTLRKDIILIPHHYSKDKAESFCKIFKAQSLIYINNKEVKVIANNQTFKKQQRAESSCVYLLTSATVGKGSTGAFCRMNIT